MTQLMSWILARGERRLLTRRLHLQQRLPSRQLDNTAAERMRSGIRQRTARRRYGICTWQSELTGWRRVWQLLRRAYGLVRLLTMTVYEAEHVVSLVW